MRRSLLDYPSVLRYLRSHLLCSVDTAEPRLALTFDDGPNPVHTPALLDLLAERKVKATFFLVGTRVERYPGLVHRIHEQGHEIGNHGHRHVPLSVLPGPWLRHEVRAAERAIAAVTGERPRFFRPPMGWFHTGVLKRLRGMGYLPVIGDVHPRDSSRPGEDTIVQHVLDRVRPGSIVILHDGGWHDGVDRSQSVNAVARVIDALHERGFAFDTLSALTNGAGA